MFLAALGAAGGAFSCAVANFLLPGMNFDYGRWGGKGTALGVTVALGWIVVHTLLY